MKTVLFRLFIVVFATTSLFQCDRRLEVNIPSPSISFSDNILTLITKESNNLIEYNNGLSSTNDESVSFQQHWERFKYTTISHDTIEYQFIKNQLFSVEINTPKHKYENIINKFENDTNLIKIKDNHYKQNNNYIVVGKRYDNGTYLVYLNDEDEEITNIFKIETNNLSFNDSVSFRNITYTENGSFNFTIQCYLFLSGYALGQSLTVDYRRILGTYDYKNHYYYNMLKP